MAIYHQDRSGWRVIRVGRTWQVQQWTSTEASGDQWWDIGTPKDTVEEAMSLMNVRAR